MKFKFLSGNVESRAERAYNISLQRRRERELLEPTMFDDELPIFGETLEYRQMIDEYNRRHNILHTSRTDNSYTYLRSDVFCYIERFDYSYDSLSEEGIETLKQDMLSKLMMNIHPSIDLEGHNGILYDVIFQDENSFTYRIEMLQ